MICHGEDWQDFVANIGQVLMFALEDHDWDMVARISDQIQDRLIRARGSNSLGRLGES